MNKHQSRLLFWSLEILLIVLIIWGCTQIDFIFRPIGTFFSTLFAPVLIAGFFFYALNPLVNLLVKIHYKRIHINRGWAAFITLLLLLGLVGIALYTFIPKIAYQIEQLALNMPTYLQDMQHYFNHLTDNDNASEIAHSIDLETYFNNIQASLTVMLRKVMLSMTKSLGTMVGMVTSVTVTVITVPFILFYMLKDGPKLLPAIQKYLPEKTAVRAGELLGRMSQTIARYISGQVIECLFVGTFSAIGYSLVGIKYALLVGVVAGLTNIIPYVGVYIGLVPALMLAMPLGVSGMVWVIVVCVIVNQVDGNLIYPNVIGKTLDIHPLTIIILLLVAGNIAGLLGVVLAVPFYAVVKTIVQYFYSIYRLQ